MIEKGETLRIETKYVPRLNRRIIKTDPKGEQDLANKLLPKFGIVKIGNQEFKSTEFSAGNMSGSFAYLRTK